MNLEQVEYKQCERCAKFGVRHMHPQAEAVIRKDTSGRVYDAGYKAKALKYCKPCQRDIEAGLDTHWKQR